MNLKVPIYFSTGLTEKANHYYKLFITWTNQKIRKTFVQRNMFEFKHIKAFDRAFADNPGPMVRPGGWGFLAAPPWGGARGPLPAGLGLGSGRLDEPTGALLPCLSPPHPHRLSSPHQACYMLASPCRSSANGRETRRTW